MLRNLISRMNTAWLVEPIEQMAKLRPPTATIVPTWGSSRNRPTGAADAAKSAERPIPKAIAAQNVVDRTRCVAFSICTRADPMPMSATVGANIASAIAIAAAP